MYVKIHKSKDSTVTAICDEDLVGKTFTENELQLSITERFYKGDKKSIEEVTEIIKKSTNLNLVGKETIAIAVKLGLVENESIIKIKNIPHIQIFEI